MSLMAMLWQPIASSSRAMSTNWPMVWTGLVVYEIVPWACLPVARTASIAVRRLRVSLSASKMRKTSIPSSAARATKARTTSSE